MPYPVFFIHPTNQSRVSLRRYARSPEPCPGKGYHNAHAFLGVIDDTEIEKGEIENAHPHDHPLWPVKCDHCEHMFDTEDQFQIFTEHLYRREGSDEDLSLRKLPIGACYNASWMADYPAYRGPDGRSLTVETPGGTWHIDSRASNCTLPNDNEHKCWVRHGRPEDGTLHVDKNGLTCSAGAGSIMCGSYHGFLHHGQLTDHC